MKQALLIVNSLLVLAVSYLLYKQFTSEYRPTITAKASLKANTDTLGGKRGMIGYINMDSIQSKYELAKKVTVEVERRRDALSNEGSKMETALKSKFDGYQEKGATMTEEQIAAAREDIERSRQNMMEKRQSQEEEFRQWAGSKNLSLMKNIQDYLKKFNADGTYSFIFSYEPGFFYYSDTAYDITSAVIKGLNQEYKTNKSK